MQVSSHEEVNGHILTYIEGENLEDEVLAGVTSYETGAQFYSEDLDFDFSTQVEASRYGKNLEEDVERYPLQHETFKDVAEGVQEGELPLSTEQVKKMLGEMTDSEKARRKMDFYY
ncbi:MAG: hypothetical protein ABEK04_02775 [Candidatus Nanohalobium sp.]